MNLSSPAAVSALLQRHSFLPAHRLGQNFLVDANVLANIVRAGELEPGDDVLEVGTGLGVLTRALAQAVGAHGRVVTIERDPRLSALHAETLPAEEFPQVRHIVGDALEIPLSVFGDRRAASGRPASTIANIPYSITSPLLGRLLEHTPAYSVIVLLVQKEVGERLAARPGTDSYGAFTVFAQFYADVEIVATVSRTVFFPPPNVASVIVRLRPRSAPAADVTDIARFFAIVHAAFQHRRKTLLNALSSGPTGWAKPRASAVLAGAGIDPMRRGETLSLSEFAAIERESAAIC